VPELPEVETLTRFLGQRCRGQVLTRVELAAISALKTFKPPLEALQGRTVVDFSRRGKYLCADLGGLWLVIHLARGGWVQWRESLVATKAKPGRGPLALRVGLSGGSGFDVTEQGTEKRLAIWVVEDPAEVEGIARLGPDPMSADFGPGVLVEALAGRPGNLKTVLVDQSVLAGVGNAYSDEALHIARLSPFKPAAKLSPEELARLYAALTEVLADALARSVDLPAAGLKGEKKNGMRVHGRTGQPCPACGDTVREVAFATRSLQYCPTCQTSGRALADRRLSRLLK
jgi:formamidopyrimidine-DNA glycosylase